MHGMKWLLQHKQILACLKRNQNMLDEVTATMQAKTYEPEECFLHPLSLSLCVSQRRMILPKTGEAKKGKKINRVINDKILPKIAILAYIPSSSPKRRMAILKTRRAMVASPNAKKATHWWQNKQSPEMFSLWRFLSKNIVPRNKLHLGVGGGCGWGIYAYFVAQGS